MRYNTSFIVDRAICSTDASSNSTVYGERREARQAAFCRGRLRLHAPIRKAGGGQAWQLKKRTKRASPTGPISRAPSGFACQFEKP
jgi:hypothetical protein